MSQFFYYRLSVCICQLVPHQPDYSFFPLLLACVIRKFRCIYCASKWSHWSTYHWVVFLKLVIRLQALSEPVFVNLLRSPGIDSQPGGPVQKPYLSYRPAMLHRLAESNPRNRFLVSLNVYKYGLPALNRCQRLLEETQDRVLFSI